MPLPSYVFALAFNIAVPRGSRFVSIVIPYGRMTFRAPALIQRPVDRRP